MNKRFYFSNILLAIVKCAGFLGVWLFLQLAISLAGSVIISVLYYGASVEEMNNLLLSFSSEMMIIANALSIIVYMIFYKMIKSSLGEKIKARGTGFSSYTSAAILGFLGQFATIFILNLLLLTVLPESWIDMLNQTNSSIMAGNPTAVFIYSVIMAPVLEEILCRGLILGTLRDAMPKWVAISLSSVVFGLLHGNPLGIIYATAFGVLLGWVYLRFNSIIPAIIAHMAFNLTSHFMNEGLFCTVMILISTPLLVAEIVLINKRRNSNDENGGNV